VVVHVSYVYLCPSGDVINSTLFLIHYLAHSFATLALPTGDGCKTISLVFSPLRIATKSEPHPNHYFAQIQAEMSPPPPLPPPLMEALVAEVLVCLPPAEPASLFRATAMSRSWNQLVSNQDAVRRYREHHGVPPLLGFFQNKEYARGRRPRFMPICEPSPPFAQPNFCSKHWMALDYRHGRLHGSAVEPSCLEPHHRPAGGSTATHRGCAGVQRLHRSRALCSGGL
jgi:hypothetical protein